MGMNLKYISTVAAFVGLSLPVAYAYPEIPEVESAEYFVDTDAGVGKCTRVDASEGINLLQISSDALASPGYHLIGVRALDNFERWSPTVTRPVFVLAPQTSVSSVEYFVDADPGVGEGSLVNVAEGANVLSIDDERLSIPGAHILGMRTCDGIGRWSPTVYRPLYVVSPVAGIEAMEYYVDEDPGEGNGYSVTFSDNSNISFSVAGNMLRDGEHILVCRCQNDFGDWIEILRESFSVAQVSGLQSVEMSNPFDIVCNGNILTLHANAIQSGSLVEVYGFDGIKIFSSVWNDTLETIEIPNLSKPVIVRVIEPNGNVTVKNTIR